MRVIALAWLTREDNPIMKAAREKDLFVGLLGFFHVNGSFRMRNGIELNAVFFSLESPLKLIQSDVKL